MTSCPRSRLVSPYFLENSAALFCNTPAQLDSLFAIGPTPLLCPNDFLECLNRWERAGPLARKGGPLPLYCRARKLRELIYRVAALPRAGVALLSPPGLAHAAPARH